MDFKTESYSERQERIAGLLKDMHEAAFKIRYGYDFEDGELGLPADREEYEHAGVAISSIIDHLQDELKLLIDFADRNGWDKPSPDVLVGRGPQALDSADDKRHWHKHHT